MKQSLLLSVVLLLLSSSFLVAPIHASNKPHPAKAPSLSPTPAPGPSNSDCSSIIFSMFACLQYLSIGSNETKPEKECCDGIETVLEYNPECICAGLVDSSQMGIDLNNTRALATPKACKLSIAPPHCGIMIPSSTTQGASVPVTSPVSPSSGRPKTLPSAANLPSAAKSPGTPSSMAEPPSVTAPSRSTSSTNNIAVPALTVAVIAFSAFSI